MKYIIIAIVIALLGWGAYTITNKDEAEIGTPAAENQTATENQTTDENESVQVETSNIKTFTVVGKPFSFSPTTIEVNKGDIVRIVFQNTGGTHDWVIDEFGARTKILQSGQSETIEFTADKSGSFEYYCSVGTHRQMGMKGTLIVK